MRLHPVNEMLSAMARAVVLIPLGFSPLVAAGVTPFFVVYGILLHANVNWSFGPLRYIIVTPRYHRWHHEYDEQAQNSNFAGMFPLYDLLFGTYYMPKDKVPSRFGCSEPVPDGLAPQLLYPFKS
jgi:sterol desaturase/sphingolipid hydroxylase (fatty acid hydroxylase superfamily)